MWLCIFLNLEEFLSKCHFYNQYLEKGLKQLGAVYFYGQILFCLLFDPWYATFDNDQTRQSAGIESGMVLVSLTFNILGLDEI